MRDLTALSALAAAEDAATGSTVAPTHFLPFKLPRHKRPLCWHRWERLLFQRILEKETQAALEEQQTISDDWYFSAWDHPNSHRTFLEDQVRLGVWQDVLLGSPAAGKLLEGKVVLDLGAGLGLLSMMCAQAGARHVYALEASPAAADLAARLVRHNGLDHKVTVLPGRAEAARLPVDKVDVIVCDWPSAFLLHDSLLPALARARARWLAPGGALLPGAAALRLVGVDDREHLGSARGFWGRGQVEGLDFSPVLNALVRHPRLDTPAKRSDLITDEVTLVEVDAATGGTHSLTFKKPFVLTARRAGRVSGLMAWFDVTFDTQQLLLDAGVDAAEAAAAGTTVLTTHPLSPATSWLQTVFSFPRALKMEAGEQLSGVVRCRPVPGAPPGRMLDVDVEISFKGMAARVAYQMRRPAVQVASL